MNRRSITRALFLATATALPAVPAMADSGAWIQLSGGTSGTANGTWANDVTGNWQGGVVADGSGNTATFNLEITAPSTITLGEMRTIGNLVFGDTNTATAASWHVVQGNNAATLTLAGTTPTVTVNTLGSNALVTISATLAGSSGLTKNGSGSTSTGVLVLNGANTYTGGTTISTGSLRAQNNSALSSGGVVVENGARLQLHNVNLANTITVSGTSALYSNSGSNTLSGTVRLAANSTATSNNGNGNTLNFGGTVELNGFTLTLNSPQGNDPINVTGSIQGTGAIVKSGAGPTTISGNNTAFNGSTTLTQGTLAIGHDNALGVGALAYSFGTDRSVSLRSSDSSARTIANALNVLSSGNGSTTISYGSGSASFNGDLTFTGVVTLGTTTSKISVLNRTEYANNVTGTGFIFVTNSTGTLVLSGSNNDYSGTTRVDSGTLVVNGTNTGSGAVTVNPGGRLGGNGSLAAAVTASGTITPGDNGIGTLTAGGLTLNSGAVVRLEVDTATDTADSLTINNGIAAVQLGEGHAILQLELLGGVNGSYTEPFVILNNTGTGGVTGFFAGLTPDENGVATFASEFVNYEIDYSAGAGGNDVVLTFSTVPEPSTIGLMGVAALGLMRRRRRTL